MFVSSRVATFVYTTLTADGLLHDLTPGGIYRDVLPQEVRAYPAVVFSCELARVTQAGRATRSRTDVTCEVRAIGNGVDNDPLLPVCDRVDRLLHGAKGEVDGIQITMCRQDAEFSRTTLESGVWFATLGSIYLITAAQPELLDVLSP